MAGKFKSLVPIFGDDFEYDEEKQEEEEFAGEKYRNEIFQAASLESEKIEKVELLFRKCGVPHGSWLYLKQSASLVKEGRFCIAFMVWSGSRVFFGP